MVGILIFIEAVLLSMAHKPDGEWNVFMIMLVLAIYILYTLWNVRHHHKVVEPEEQP